MTQNIDINMTAKPSVNLFYENLKNLLFIRDTLLF